MATTAETRTTEAEADVAPLPLTPLTRLLLTPAEAATVLRISPRLLWALTKSKEIPCVRLGKAVRYSPNALQEFVDSRQS